MDSNPADHKQDMGLDLKLNFIRIKLNIASTRDAFDERKTLKLTDSSNNKESFLGTIIGARTTEPVNFTSAHTSPLEEAVKCQPIGKKIDAYASV